MNVDGLVRFSHPHHATKGWSLEAKLRYYSDRTGGDDACWLWHGSINGRGYGRVFWKGGMKLAHREAWKMANGAIPQGLLVCHRCDVKRCVNPRHLFLGSAQANTDDMKTKGRQCLGERVKSSKLTAAQVVAIRADNRPYKVISREYGIGLPNISWIKTGKGWRHL